MTGSTVVDNLSDVSSFRGAFIGHGHGSVPNITCYQGITGSTLRLVSRIIMVLPNVSLEYHEVSNIKLLLFPAKAMRWEDIWITRKAHDLS